MKKSKEYIQLFYKGELYIIGKEYKKELEKFLDERRTSVGYLYNHNKLMEILH